MFVRCLIARFARIVSGATRGPRTRRDAKRASPVMRAAIHSAATDGHPVARARICNWLEDGKRLRPLRTMRARFGDGTPLGLSTACGDATGDATFERVATASLRANDGVVSASPPAAGPAAVSPPTTPWSAPISAENVMRAADGVDEERRRLIFVRYLVRQRVYNEGFGADELPEQYRWSGLPEIENNH